MERSAAERDWQQLIGKRLEHVQNNDDTITSEVGISLGMGVGSLINRNNFHNNIYGTGNSKMKLEEESQPMVRYQKTKVIPSRVRKRVIFKNGNVNLSKEHVYKRSQRYLQDIFTTLVDIQWRWNLLVFAMGFIVSWLIFGVVWWLIMFAHGDFEGAEAARNVTPCVMNVNSFTAAFLFSLETQHTIGYGHRMVSEECPEAVFILCLQSVVGVMIQCFMVGIVFAKLSRPKKRSQTLLFSRHAVICLRDGKMCLLFRVGDMRKSHIIGTNISAQIIKRKVTQEGEVIPYYHTMLDVRFDAGTDSILFIWPATIVHEINEKSPLYTLSAEDIMKDRFEIVVVLEGTIESTGQSIQARSSYLPSEILWGHRFEQLVRFQRDSSEYLVDYSKFNNTYEVETPLCSARDFYEYQRLIQQPPMMIINTPHNQTGQNTPVMTPGVAYNPVTHNDNNNQLSRINNNNNELQHNAINNTNTQHVNLAA